MNYRFDNKDHKESNKDTIIDILLYYFYYFPYYVYGFQIFLTETILKPNKKIRIIIVIFLYSLNFSAMTIKFIYINKVTGVRVLDEFIFSFIILVLSYIICLIKIRPRKIIHILFVEIIIVQFIVFTIYYVYYYQ